MMYLPDKWQRSEYLRVQKRTFCRLSMTHLGHKTELQLRRENDVEDEKYRIPSICDRWEKDMFNIYWE